MVYSFHILLISRQKASTIHTLIIKYLHNFSSDLVCIINSLENVQCKKCEFSVNTWSLSLTDNADQREYYSWKCYELYWTTCPCGPNEPRRWDGGQCRRKWSDCPGSAQEVLQRCSHSTGPCHNNRCSEQTDHTEPGMYTQKPKSITSLLES